MKEEQEKWRRGEDMRGRGDDGVRGQQDDVPQPLVSHEKMRRD
jgi:hypothetical protein